MRTLREQGWQTVYSNCKPKVHKVKNYERHLGRIAMWQHRYGRGMPETTDLSPVCMLGVEIGK